MVAPHKTRRDLDVPDFVKQRWLSGGHRQEMACCLKEANFDKVGPGCKLLSGVPCYVCMHMMARRAQDTFIARVEKIVSKEEVYELKKDEGWYSEAEMEGELGWSKHCPEIPMQTYRPASGWSL